MNKYSDIRESGLDGYKIKGSCKGVFLELRLSNLFHRFSLIANSSKPNKAYKIILYTSPYRIKNFHGNLLDSVQKQYVFILISYLLKISKAILNSSSNKYNT